ncbi:predicted protein [Thalassiosira pseudonana CCMP1335]|uniref:Uncharacterized protein n=1 Tax=Thalassiosira pseudonana TaxID=35128 RepID=B8BQ54_THAPS|nr:predicted protein [Thalassiosira pseudonana CCMP1335]EED95727.1 predicted protein [Thalassiosira pseudonana CCMP1335]|eukprot:g656.t1 g656   contig10:473134-474600(+)
MSFHNNPHHNHNNFIPDNAASLSSGAYNDWEEEVRSNAGGSVSSGNRGRGHHDRHDDSSSLRRDREREGRCADCGAQTHDLVYNPETGSMRKEPLNVENEVHRGRCLLCHPLPMRLVSMAPVALRSSNLSLAVSDVSSQSASARSAHYSANSGTQASRSPQNYQHQQFQQQQQYLDRRSYMRDVQQPASARSLGDENGTIDRRAAFAYQRSSSRSLDAAGQETVLQPPQQQFEQRQNLRGRWLDNYNLSNRSIGTEHSTASIYSNQSYESARNQQQQLQNQLRDVDMSTNISNLVLHENRSNEFHHTNHTESNSNSAQSQEGEDMCEIISAMRRDLNNVSLQTQSLHSLWVLSWEHENANAIGRVGGIPPILDAMRAHPTAMTLHSNGIAALQNLAGIDYNRTIITDSDGVNLIVATMGQFLDVQSIQLSGCTALANLSNGSVEHKSKVAENGGILAMMRAVDSHRGDESVLRAAYQALRKLGFNPGS